ncbi:hypothetical protein [Pseudomonas qingdaonensis]|uniref:hypothetical protein n=1 Tax=Pseudomonas qingdaonensis TaxID=2056231 RepID=UPI0028AAFB6F|nr:hypothetical protein [Pseudomonas qingdaonensis]
MTKQELLRFRLKAYIGREENKKNLAARRMQLFEEKTEELFTHISAILAEEPGIKVTTIEPFLQVETPNVGDLEIDIVGKKVQISPALKGEILVLEVKGLAKEALHLELGDNSEWRAVDASRFSWYTLDDDFWFTHLADLVPK